jgi:hypothetical protein
MHRGERSSLDDLAAVVNPYGKDTGPSFGFLMFDPQASRPPH